MRETGTTFADLAEAEKRARAIVKRRYSIIRIQKVLLEVQ